MSTWSAQSKPSATSWTGQTPNNVTWSTPPKSPLINYLTTQSGLRLTTQSGNRLITEQYSSGTSWSGQTKSS